jgi:hypothetical protein
VRIEAIEEALQARPFVPFRLVMPSDRSVPVPHPEFVSIAPGKKWLLVWKKNGGWSVVEPAMIAELAFNGSSRRRAP